MNKNILILGHKQHGKGTFCELLKKYHHIDSISSSTYANNKFIFPTLAPIYGYSTAEECFEDRHSHREEWFELIKSYNTPDATRMAREMLELCPAYDGMRNDIEFFGCLSIRLFDLILWVDAADRKPLESEKSMKIKFDPNIMIKVDNNGPDHLMEDYVKSLDFSDHSLYQKLHTYYQNMR